MIRAEAFRKTLDGIKDIKNEKPRELINAPGDFYHCVKLLGKKKEKEKFSAFMKIFEPVY